MITWKGPCNKEGHMRPHYCCALAIAWTHCNHGYGPVEPGGGGFTNSSVALALLYALGLKTLVGEVGEVAEEVLDEVR